MTTPQPQASPATLRPHFDPSKDHPPPRPSLELGSSMENNGLTSVDYDEYVVLRNARLRGQALLTCALAMKPSLPTSRSSRTALQAHSPVSLYESPQSAIPRIEARSSHNVGTLRHVPRRHAQSKHQSPRSLWVPALMLSRHVSKF